jgi:hypothetical protein
VGAASRFDTMPSKPNLQACSTTVAPFSSVCSLKTIPADDRTSSRHFDTYQNVTTSDP